MRTLTLSVLLSTASAIAQTVLPPFNATYSAVDLGQLPGVTDYGGLAFRFDNPNVLLVSAYTSNEILALPVVRDAQGRISGCTAGTLHASVGGNDGGLAYGPGNVLFHTAFPANELGQLKPGSITPDRVIALAPLGVPFSVGACGFVPAGRGGAGRLKLCTYSSSEWFDVTLAPDAQGTYSITAVGAPVQLANGPEGIVYPPANAPLLGGQVLVAEWNTGTVAVYATDNLGDPLPGSRQEVMSGVPSVGGGAVDPLTGDVLFTMASGRLVALRQGAVCGTATAYGPATAANWGTPALSATGCARLGQTVTLQVTGRPSAFGALVMGDFPAMATIQGVTLLVSPLVSLGHALDGTGRFTLALPIPGNSGLGNLSLFFQAGYLEPQSQTGFSATRGLDLWIR